MEYRKAELPDLGTVFTLSQDAIRAAYPYYYPAAAVEWFANQHSCENILADITAGQVRLLEVNGVAVGTATIDGNRLLRVFVAPEQQQKGYGTRLLKQLEQEVGRTHPAAILDSSLPAARFFQNRGYRTRSHERFDIEDGHGLLLAILAWEVMEKPLCEGAAIGGAQAATAKAPAPTASTPALEVSGAAIEKAETPESRQSDAAAPEASPAAAKEASPKPAAEPPAATPEPKAKPEPAAKPEPEPEPEAKPTPELAPEPDEPGTSTVRISAAAADVMKQLPQMPF